VSGGKVVTTFLMSPSFRKLAKMPKGLMYGLVIALTVTIAGYVVLKALKVDGADTLAIGISSIISIFVAMQNASMSKEIEKVRNQTNGMTHHVMRENQELRRAKTIADPADITYDSDRNNNDDHG
jgi:hypothetical protein